MPGADQRSRSQQRAGRLTTVPARQSGSGQQLHSPASVSLPVRAFSTTEKSVYRCAVPASGLYGLEWSQLMALAWTSTTQTSVLGGMPTLISRPDSMGSPLA